MNSRPSLAEETLSDQSQKSSGRLQAQTAESLMEIFERPHLEREKKQFYWFVKVDLAHTVMLCEKRIISSDQATKLFEALKKIQKAGPSDAAFDARRGSMLFQIEQLLATEIGDDLAGRLHIGRSRLDQGPTVRRLFKRHHLLAVMDEIVALRHALVEKAAAFRDVVMPGYTCMQHAHPAGFGHYLLSFVSRLEDDFERLADAYRRLNLSPLGGAGLSGTSWPIDRNRTAELLGFDGIVKNSKLARDAHYAAEVASGLAMVMSTLNELATDLHIWSSYEFGFVELADEFCGTSSIFPQKKNPTALEAVKFAAGEAISWPSIILTTFRAEGTGDVVMKEAPILDRAFQCSREALAIMAPVIRTMSVDIERMRDLASANWSTATVLADNLVRDKNLSFRTAHALTARFIRLSIDRGHSPDKASGTLLDLAARDLGLPGPGLGDVEVRDVFDAEAFMRSRTSAGSINPTEVDVLQHEAAAAIQSSKEWLQARRNRLETADLELERAMTSIGDAVQGQ